MAETNNKKILIVEDDKDFLFILQKKFTAEGFQVVNAQDGEAGANMAEMENPDLIISDILLPKMNGTEMAKKIKALKPETKIIFLTNVKDIDYIGDEIKSGGYDCLIKSDLHIEDIVAKVKNKLGV